MKIVTRDQFVLLPAGTVYAKYQPCCFEELCIKGDSISGVDFFSQSVIEIEAKDSGQYMDRLDQGQYLGESIAMDLNVQGRDGCFDDKQLFAVYEPQDVRGLIDRLQQALRDSA